MSYIVILALCCFLPVSIHAARKVVSAEVSPVCAKNWCSSLVSSCSKPKSSLLAPERVKMMGLSGIFFVEPFDDPTSMGLNGNMYSMNDTDVEFLPTLLMSMMPQYKTMTLRKVMAVRSVQTTAYPALNGGYLVEKVGCVIRRIPTEASTEILPFSGNSNRSVDGNYDCGNVVDVQVKSAKWDAPMDLTFVPDTYSMYITEFGTPGIKRISLSSLMVTKWVTFKDTPHGITQYRNVLYVGFPDPGNAIRAVSAVTGAVLMTQATPWPIGLHADCQGNRLLISNYQDNLVRQMDFTTKALTDLVIPITMDKGVLGLMVDYSKPTATLIITGDAIIYLAKLEDEKTTRGTECVAKPKQSRTYKTPTVILTTPPPTPVPPTPVPPTPAPPTPAPPTPVPPTPEPPTPAPPTTQPPPGATTPPDTTMPPTPAPIPTPGPTDTNSPTNNNATNNGTTTESPSATKPSNSSTSPSSPNSTKAPAPTTTYPPTRTPRRFKFVRRPVKVNDKFVMKTVTRTFSQSYYEYPVVPTYKPPKQKKMKKVFRVNRTVTLTSSNDTDDDQESSAALPTRVESLAERLAFYSLIIGIAATLFRATVSPTASFQLPRMTSEAIFLISLCSEGHSDSTDPGFIVNPTTLNIWANSTYATAMTFGAIFGMGSVGIYYFVDRYGYRFGGANRWPGWSLVLPMYFYQPCCYSAVRILWLNHYNVSGAHIMGWFGILGCVMFIIALGATLDMSYHITWSHMHAAHRVGRHWCLVVDFCFQFVFCNISGFTSPTNEWCNARLFGMLCVHVVHLGFLMLMRPFKSGPETVMIGTVDLALCLALGLCFSKDIMDVGMYVLIASNLITVLYTMWLLALYHSTRNNNAPGPGSKISTSSPNVYEGDEGGDDDHYYGNDNYHEMGYVPGVMKGRSGAMV